LRLAAQKMSSYYLTNDLFFSSRVTGVAQRLGLDLRVVGSVDRISEDCSLVVLDLTLPSLDVAVAVPSIKERCPAARVVAYGPHVHEPLLAAATAAGCDEVLSRGQFDREVERVLRSAV
jgi:DNA-binding NarL/FixJ family response regulator